MLPNKQMQPEKSAKPMTLLMMSTAPSNEWDFNDTLL